MWLRGSGAKLKGLGYNCQPILQEASRYSGRHPLLRNRAAVQESITVKQANTLQGSNCCRAGMKIQSRSGQGGTSEFHADTDKEFLDGFTEVC